MPFRWKLCTQLVALGVAAAFPTDLLAGSSDCVRTAIAECKAALDSAYSGHKLESAGPDLIYTDQQTCRSTIAVRCGSGAVHHNQSSVASESSASSTSTQTPQAAGSRESAPGGSEPAEILKPIFEAIGGRMRKGSGSNSNGGGGSARSGVPVSTTNINNVNIVSQAVDIDIGECTASAEEANRCCGNPQSCGAQMASGDQASVAHLNEMMRSGKSASMVEVCRKMRALGSAAGNANAGFAGVCYDSQGSCAATCAAMAQKYSSLLSACSNCSTRNQLDSAIQSLGRLTSTCANLRARGDQLAENGMGTASAQAAAQACGEQTASAPRQDASSAVKDNSPLALPKDLRAPPKAQDTNDTQAASQLNKPAGEFGPLPTEDGFTGYKTKSETEAPALQKPVLDTRSKDLTQVNEANQVDSAQEKPTIGAVKDKSQKGTSPSHSGHEDLAPIRRLGDQFDNSDLSDFLPGGSRSAARRLASVEINAKEEDIFRRISLKYAEKCLLGVLKDCPDPRR